MKSLLINMLSEKLKKERIESILSKNLAEETRKTIDLGKDINYNDFIKPKAGNKPLFRTGKLYNSIKAKKNIVEMMHYGSSLQNGKKMLPRKFIPVENSEVFKKLIERSFKEILK